jgi:Domain of unknown function (DUF4345)
MRAFAVFVLLLSGLSLLVFGAAIAYAPLKVMAMADVVATGAAASVEIRAFYGGLELALGALILICAWYPEYRREGLWLTLFVYAGIGVARLIGMIFEDVSTDFLRIALIVELVIAALAALALYLTRRT